MIVVAIADTHLKQCHIPDGDVLIHAGDLTFVGNIPELSTAAMWLHSLPHPLKIVVAGNHDLAFDSPLHHYAKTVLEADHRTVYLQDGSYQLGNWKVYGSPWQPKFWGAFNLERGPAIAQKWAAIPSDTDILITHGPPFGIGDQTGGEHAGCHDLLRRVDIIQPALHIFGHLHDGHGVYTGAGKLTRSRRTIHVNASLLNDAYEVKFRPVVIHIDEKEVIVLDDGV